MAILDIDLDSPSPLHEAVAASVRRAIAAGELGAGELLPPARELAAAVGVNVNTVLRAYRNLRDEGLIDLRRGRGATVRDVGVDQARLVALADDLLTEARRLGMPMPAVHDLLERRA